MKINNGMVLMLSQEWGKEGRKEEGRCVEKGEEIKNKEKERGREGLRGGRYGKREEERRREVRKSR